MAALAKLGALIRDTGRKSEEVGLEVWVSPGAGNEDDGRPGNHILNAGVTHVTAHTTYFSKHHRHVDGRRSTAEHLPAFTRYRAAVADLL